MGRVSTAEGQRHSCNQPVSARKLREGGAITGRDVLRSGEKSKSDAYETINETVLEKALR